MESEIQQMSQTDVFSVIFFYFFFYSISELCQCVEGLESGVLDIYIPKQTCS